MDAATDGTAPGPGAQSLQEAVAQRSSLAELQRLAVEEMAVRLGGAATLWFDEPAGLELAAFHHPDLVARQDMAELTAGSVHVEGTFLRGVLTSGVPVALTGDQVRSLSERMAPAYRAYFERHGVSGMLLHPLRCQGRDLGVLGVSRDAGRPPFEPEDVDELVRASHMLSVALDCARMLESTRQSGAAFARLALTDALTGLPNRRAFLEAVVPDGSCCGVLLLDLDDFKEVNDGFGHAVGDLVLAAYGRRLELAAPPGALVARLGGDEFAVLLRADTVAQVRSDARQVAAEARSEVVLGDLSILVRASSGLSVAGAARRADPWSLLQEADLAMYRAKRHGLGHTEHHPELDASASRRVRDVVELRAAIRGGGLVLHYQRLEPVRPAGGPLRVEALVRWDRQGVLQAPGTFLPLAAGAGLMTELTQEVLRQAIAQVAAWRAEGVRAQVAVNVPASVLVEPGFGGDLREQLRRAGLGTDQLVVEVSDAELGDAAARGAVRTLRKLGLAVHVADFGTGRASLGALLEAPVTGIKLGRSLVSGAGRQRRRRVLLSHLVRLAHDLGVEVVGEGVESESDRAALRAAGVDLLQGFLLHEPGPATAALPRARR